MKKRLYSPTFGLFVCLACLHTCCSIPPPPDESEMIKLMVQSMPPENDQVYQINQEVALNRPLRCYLKMYYAARSEEYAGTLVWRDISHQTTILLQSKEYIEIPAGAKVFLQNFFVYSHMRTYPSDSSDGKKYFLTLTIPSRPDLNAVAYFMGSNGTLQPLPWDSGKHPPFPGTFRPVDIESLFPGGEWFPAPPRDLPRSNGQQNSSIHN